MVSVQPGIESLSSSVLKLMDKGVTGCQNVPEAELFDFAYLFDAPDQGVSRELQTRLDEACPRGRRLIRRAPCRTATWRRAWSW